MIGGFSADVITFFLPYSFSVDEDIFNFFVLEHLPLK